MTKQEMLVAFDILKKMSSTLRESLKLAETRKLLTQMLADKTAPKVQLYTLVSVTKIIDEALIRFDRALVKAVHDHDRNCRRLDAISHDQLIARTRRATSDKQT